MQPQVIHWRAELPISPNGKLDRAGLYQELCEMVAVGREGQAA